MRTGTTALAVVIAFTACHAEEEIGQAQLEVGKIKSQLRGYDLGPPFPAGFRDSGLVNGYAEGEWVPFVAVIEGVKLENSDELAGSVGDGLYLAQIIVPTYSERHNANAISDLATEGTYGQGAITPIPDPFDDGWLVANGYSPFVLGAYSDVGDADLAPVIGQPAQRTGPTRFGGNVSSVSVPITFTASTSATVVELQFAVRLSPPDLEPITPEGQAFPGTVAGTALGAADFFPGPGPIFVGYEVGKPTGIATVPIRVDRHSCSSSEECLPGEYCAGGDTGCVEPCVDDSTCPSDELCENGSCQEPPPSCVEEEDCTGEMTCVGGYCVPPCPEFCADPEFCGIGPCMPPDGGTPPCVIDDQCQPGFVCEGGTCEPPSPPCDVSCPEGEECLEGECIPPGEPCSDDSNCPGGEVCVDDVCHPTEPPCPIGDCTTCDWDAECPGGFTCEAGVCVPLEPPQPCQDSVECPDGQTCEGGFCTPPGEPCGPDGECGPGELCETDSGTCIPEHPPIPCTDDSDCPSGDTCDFGFCEPPPEPCGPGDVCGSPGELCENSDGSKVCVPEHPPIPCDGANDCPSGDSCVGGFCSPDSPTPCKNDNQCGGDDVCNKVDGKDGYCEPPPKACDSNFDCSTDYCVGGFCEPPHPPIACQGDNDCPAGDECAGGFCQPPPQGCTYDEQCHGDDVCAGGSCSTPHPPIACQGEADCPAGDECIGGFCEPPIDCTTDGQCPGGELCEPGYVGDAGQCQPGQPPTPCEYDDECPPPGDDVYIAVCSGGFCRTSGGDCTDSSECSGGEICVVGHCLPGSDPLPCNSSFECGNGMLCMGGFCEPAGDPNECSSGDDCPSSSWDDVGEACIGGVCSGSSGAPEGCISSDSCPAGRTCEGGFCLPAEGACDLDSDCAAGEECLAGWCGVACAQAATNPCDSTETCAIGRCANECATYLDCARSESCYRGGCVPAALTVASAGGDQTLWMVELPGSDDNVSGGCSVSDGSSTSAGAWLLALLLVVRRRRRGGR